MFNDVAPSDALWLEHHQLWPDALSLCVSSLWPDAYARPLFSLYSLTVTFQNTCLFFGFGIALKVDLGHIICLVSAIIVLIVVAQLVVIFATITQQRILDVYTVGIATTLRWEADLTKHTGMLIDLANPQTHLPLLHSGNS